MTPDQILNAADKLQPALRKAFLEAVDALRASVPISDLADALESLGDIPDLLAQIRLSPEELKPIREILEEAVTATASVTAAEFNLDFTLVNPQAVRWAEEHSGMLIRGLDEETLNAVRRVVVAGQAEGVNVREQAKLIRSLVGLTERDALAVDRMWRGGLETGEAQAERSAQRMADRLLRRRAENIARTETINASNMGTQLANVAARDKGLLPQDAQKVWIVTNDSRLCPICSALAGETVGLTDTFSIGVVTPTAHPGCRCTTGIVV